MLKCFTFELNDFLYGYGLGVCIKREVKLTIYP